MMTTMVKGLKTTAAYVVTGGIIAGFVGQWLAGLAYLTVIALAIMNIIR